MTTEQIATTPEAVRDILRKQIHEHGDLTKLATRLGISHSHLHGILNNNTKAGPKVYEALGLVHPGYPDSNGHSHLPVASMSYGTTLEVISTIRKAVTEGNYQVATLLLEGLESRLRRALNGKAP